MDSEETAKSTFDQLAKGGQIHTSFQKISWGAHYGRFTNKFGINWIIKFKK